MVVLDGGCEIKINIGIYEYMENTIELFGDKFIVNAVCEARVTADGTPVYRIELCLPEMPNTRMIEITRLDEGRISVELTELPNHKIVEALVEKATSGLVLGFVSDLLERRFGEGFIEKRLETSFAPVLIGADESVEGYEKIVEEQERVRREESRTVKMIRGVVDRFFKEDEENGEKEKEKEKEKGKFPLSSIIGLFKK
jgi:hypothetical protein